LKITSNTSLTAAGKRAKDGHNCKDEAGRRKDENAALRDEYLFFHPSSFLLALTRTGNEPGHYLSSPERFIVILPELIKIPGVLAKMIESDLLQPYEKLIRIEVLGQPVEVPENNPLLRCFQYLSMKTISYGDFCWNGECTNCQIWYHGEEQSETDDKTALACRMTVSEGIVITRMSSFIKLEGINK
jgi:hypothetical protein